MDIQLQIKTAIQKVLKTFNVSHAEIVLERPGDTNHGDFATNIALVLAKQTKSNPRELAEKIVGALREQKIKFMLE